MTKKPMTADEKAAHFAGLKQALQSNPAAVMARTRSSEVREPAYPLSSTGLALAEAQIANIEAKLEISLTSEQRSSFLEMFAEIVELHQWALDDWNARAVGDAERPAEGFRTARQWFYLREGMKLGQPHFDYGADEGGGFEQSWQQFWTDHHGKAANNSGRSRTGGGGHAVTPLYVVFLCLEGWFKAVLHRPFAPRIDGNTDHLGNRSAELFEAVAHCFQPNYTRSNLATVVRNIKKWRKEAAKLRS